MHALKTHALKVRHLQWRRCLFLALLVFPALGCGLFRPGNEAVLPTVAATADPPSTVTQPPSPAATPAIEPSATDTLGPSPTTLAPTFTPLAATPLATVAVPATDPPTSSPTVPLSATLSLPTVTPNRATPPVSEMIGSSSQGRPITVVQFGRGPAHILLIGGIHGGYEWNTILLAYRVIDYFSANPDAIPESVTLHIIPSANPDGQFLVTGKEGRFNVTDVDPDNFAGRFNGNAVDLNRNWDCEWTPTALWRDQEISGGERPFSEPESLALRDYIMNLNPVAVVFWHSAADGAYAAGCPAVYPPSYTLATIYGLAAGYPVYERFTSYPVTGDAGDWLALQAIPSISVELVTHQSLDWEKNLAGIAALLEQYRLIGR